jgi:hypothetical protein
MLGVEHPHGAHTRKSYISCYVTVSYRIKDYFNCCNNGSADIQVCVKCSGNLCKRHVVSSANRSLQTNLLHNEATTLQCYDIPVTDNRIIGGEI